jgi:hypothetical protein
MNKAKITVPDNLVEITLGQYQDYLKDIDGLDEELDQDKINNKAIEAFCWTNYDSLMSIPIKDYERILEVLNRAFKANQPFIKKFNLGDFKFGFIPKLDEMSLGEYIDLETYFNDWQEMHKAMAILYRPIAAEKKSKYGIIPYDPNSDRQDMMKDMPLSVAMGCTVFFYRLGTELSKATLSYLEMLKKRKDINSQVKMALERNGDGISRFMDSLKETSEDLKRSLPFQYTNA